jgi:hypothetical protein
MFHSRRWIALLLPLSASVGSKGPPRISGEPPRGPLEPFVIDMMATHHPDSGIPIAPILFHDTMERVRWHGRDAMKRETATTLPGGTEFVRWATVIFDATTLLPYFSELRRKDGLFLRREFDGVHVKEKRSTKDFVKTPPLPPGETVESRSAEFDLPEPGFTWIENTGLPILLALPLRHGLQGSVPVISGDRATMKPCLEGPCFILRMSYRVLGAEEMAGFSPDPVPSWKISVPETGFTFWIAETKPRLVQVYWPGPGGNGTFSMGPVQRP